MWGRIPSRHRLLFTAVSPISGKVNVWQNGEKRILEVGGYAQSIDKESGRSPNTVWGKTAAELVTRVSNIQSILILGLGGGTEVHLLVEKFPNALVDGVELDPAVVEIGRRFFDLDEISNLQVVTANAIDVVEKPKNYPLRSGKYSAIIVDIYIGGGTPSSLESGRTLSGIRTLLDDEGVAVFNRMSRLNPRGFRAELEGVFDNIEEVGVVHGWGLPPGNILFFCRR